MLLGVASGCASGGSIEPANPINEKLGQYSDVQLKVSSKEEYPTKFVAALETAILTELRERSMFRSYRSETEQAPAELRIDATIVSASHVSKAARVLTGAFAGRAKMEVLVELTDLARDKSIGSFIAKGHSSGGTIFAGDTSQAIEKVAEQIADFLLEHK